MKKYKNVWLSLGFYILAVLFTYVIPQPFNPLPFIVAKFGNGFQLAPFLILIFVGIFFALRSNASKESSWAGGLMIFLGVLILLSPWILGSYAFWGFLYNLGIR